MTSKVQPIVKLATLLSKDRKYVNIRLYVKYVLSSGHYYLASLINLSVNLLN